MGLARGLGSNEKVEMTRSAGPGEGRTVLIYGFLPWICWLPISNEATLLRDATQNVLMHFAARAMLSS